MKKIITAIRIVALCVCSLCACVDDNIGDGEGEMPLAASVTPI